MYSPINSTLIEKLIPIAFFRLGTFQDHIDISKIKLTVVLFAID